MKKTILAAAMTLAMSAASAQSVEIYGKMRVYGDHDRVGTTSAVSRLTNDTSRLGLRATEKITNDLSAFFVLETNVQTDAPAATSLGDRTSVVGLRSSAGSLALGRDTHAYYNLLASHDPFGIFYGSSAETVHPMYGRRFSNAGFVTLNATKHITAFYNHAASETTTGKDQKSFGANFNFGPGSISAARIDDGTNTTNALGAKFTLSATGTILSGLYSDSTINGVELQGKTIGVTQRIVGPLSALAAYNENENVKGYNLGASYNLSKRTMLHARYRQETSSSAALERRQAGVGIEHNF